MSLFLYKRSYLHFFLSAVAYSLIWHPETAMREKKKQEKGEIALSVYNLFIPSLRWPTFHAKQLHLFLTPEALFIFNANL